jgi:alpha-galactosidase
MRAVVQTRSDTACAPGRGDWDQAQTHGLNLFLPVHATICWGLSAYDCRSSAAAGFLGEWDILDPQFPVEQARAAIAEIRENQKYWLGDYYPLTGCSTAGDAWMAWQLHRGDLGEGIVLAFRHAASPYVALQAHLEALNPAATYEVTFINEQRQPTTRRMAGAELGTLDLRIEKPGESLLVRYKEARK